MTTPEKQRAWREANRERVRAIKRRSLAKIRARDPEAWREKQRKRNLAWRAKNRDRIRVLNRIAGLRRYGLTPQAYTALLEQQGGRCALCSCPPEMSLFGKLYVDHDHNINKVRGLLCYACNTALGQLGDNAEGLSKALSYITQHG